MMLFRIAVMSGSFFNNNPWNNSQEIHRCNKWIIRPFKILFGHVLSPHRDCKSWLVFLHDKRHKIRGWYHIGRTLFRPFSWNGQDLYTVFTQYAISHVNIHLVKKYGSIDEEWRVIMFFRMAVTSGSFFNDNPWHN